MNALLNKEHIRRRVDSEDGLSLTEFFYTILQSYDFAYLSEKYDCTLQIGGSD
jgi:tyrosyl-tRNA synthetase